MHKIILTTSIFLLVPNFAYAYLDLGTFTVFFQAIVAGIIGSILTIKLWWSSFVNFFKKLSDKKKKSNKDDIDQNETKR